MSTISGHCFCNSIRFEFVIATVVSERRAHIWACDKPEWMIIGDELPVYEENIGSLNMPSTHP